MTRNALRIAWTITAIAALALLVATVALAMRARSLPPTAATAQPATAPSEENAADRRAHPPRRQWPGRQRSDCLRLRPRRQP